MQIHSLLQREEDKMLICTSNYEKLCLLDNIISIKRTLSTYSEQEQFLDLKRYLKFYAGAVDESYFGYYQIDDAKVLRKISQLQLDKQRELLNFLKRQLRKEGNDANFNSLEDDLNHLNLGVHKDEFEKSSGKRRVVAFYKYARLYLTSTIYRLIIVLIMVFVMLSLILLPAPFKFLGVFKIEYESYSTSFITNHFLNVLCYVFQIENDFKIIPKNPAGVLGLIIIKVSILLFLLNFLSKEAKKKLNIE